MCRALGLGNSTVAVARLDEDERSKFNLGRQGEATIINEPGLYALVLSSRKPEAKPLNAGLRTSRHIAGRNAFKWQSRI